MRSSLAEAIAQDMGDDLLTTGEAATLLGTSRQHIVDLCQSGDLQYTVVGKHRRIRRGDVTLLRDAGNRLTRDQLRSLHLAYAVAGKVALDPSSHLELARRNLEKMRAASPRGASKVWLDEWDRLLDGSLHDLLEALTSRSPRSRELRQNTPFAGSLTQDEREAALAGAAFNRRKVRP